MGFSDLQDLIGRTVYSLRVGQVQSYRSEGYVYRIYPAELIIQEIRFGEANRQIDEEYYGPGFITLLCKHEKGYIQAFSPIGDEILSNSCVAGRNTRAFLDRDDLYHEAKLLKECVLKNYKHVSSVEIGLPKRDIGLDEKIIEACVRSEICLGSENEVLLSNDKEL